jgi:plasmid maintenance system antidote protein VapI
VKQAQPARVLSTSLGVSVTQLARVLHVSRPTMRRVLAGDYPPTPDEAARVAAYLGIEERALWRDERWPRPRRTR